MNCPACNEPISIWRMMTFRFDGGFRCRECGVLLYLDQNDFNRRARPMFVTSAVFLVFGAGVCAHLQFSIFYALLVVMVGATIWTLPLVNRTRLLLGPDARSRRKQRYLRLGGLTGGVFWGGFLLIQTHRGSFDKLFYFLVPFLLVSLVFFTLAYRPDKGSRKI